MVAMKSRFSLIACTIVLILCVASQIALVSAAAVYQDESAQRLYKAFGASQELVLRSNSKLDYLRITAPNGAKLSLFGLQLKCPRILQSVTGNI